MSAAERRALILLLSLGLVGQGVRWWLTRPGTAPGEVQLLTALPPRSPDGPSGQHPGAEPAAGADRADRRRPGHSRRAGPPPPGRSRARQEDRGGSRGPGSVRLAGRAGPGLRGRARPPRRPSVPILPFPAPSGPVAALPITPSQPGAPGGSTAGEPVDLNAADVASLDALPGIGPSRALAVVRYREAHGPFRAVQDLARVPGFGPAALNRLAGRVRVGP